MAHTSSSSTSPKKKTPETKWVGTLHAALALGCSVQTLYRWSTTKTFPENAVTRDCYGNLYDVDAVKAWCAARTPNRVGRPFGHASRSA